MRCLSERVARYVWREDSDVEFYSAPEMLGERLFAEYEAKLALLFPVGDYDDSYDDFPMWEAIRVTSRVKRDARFISKRKEVK